MFAGSAFYVLTTRYQKSDRLFLSTASVVLHLPINSRQPRVTVNSWSADHAQLHDYNSSSANVNVVYTVYLFGFKQYVFMQDLSCVPAPWAASYAVLFQITF